MTAAETFLALHVRGIRLRVTRDGALGVTPATALDADLRAAIREHRTQLLALMKGDLPVPPDPTVAPTAPCSVCASVVWWRRPGEAELHCGTCEPPTSWREVLSYLTIEPEPGSRAATGSRSSS